MADSSTLARPYARAVFALARADEALGAWSAALSTAAQIVAEPAARTFLSRRDLDPASRAAFLQSVCEAGGDSEVLGSASGRNLLRLLAENDRLSIVPEIATQFEQLKARAENTVRVQLVTASGVEEAVVERIRLTLQRSLGRAVELELQQDPGLLGGAVIHAEGRVIDGSVKSRLNELAETLVS